MAFALSVGLNATRVSSSILRMRQASSSSSTDETMTQQFSRQKFRERPPAGWRALRAVELRPQVIAVLDDVALGLAEILQILLGLDRRGAPGA